MDTESEAIVQNALDRVSKCTSLYVLSKVNKLPRQGIYMDTESEAIVQNALDRVSKCTSLYVLSKVNKLPRQGI